MSMFSYGEKNRDLRHQRYMRNSIRIYGLFKEGHSKEDKLSVVHCVQFPMTSAQQAALRDHTVLAAITVDHPAYRANTAIPEEIREELVKDLY